MNKKPFSIRLIATSFLLIAFCYSLRRAYKSLFYWLPAYLFILITGCSLQPGAIILKSPDDNLQFELKVEADLTYLINWKNDPLILPSTLGFQFNNGISLTHKIKIKGIKESVYNELWQPVYGEQANYEDHYKETLIQLSSAAIDNFSLRVRAYNAGIAFRYEFNESEPLIVDHELTAFTFTKNPTVWASKQAQSEIVKQKLSDLSAVSERPLLVEIETDVFIALCEAGLVDFARMKFEKDTSTANTLQAHLEKGREDVENKGLTQGITVPADDYQTPWRLIMVGRSPAEILQNNYILLNLNEENKIPNTSWIKPGKVIREVTLTTTGGLACVDFAKKHNLQFVEFDAGWYGNEYDTASDASTVTVDPNRSKGPLDLPQVIAYAKKQGIGIILYVNRRALEKQLDELLPLYESWGVAGLKYGFVNVGPQEWTIWLHEAVRKAAKYNLMVDVHDEYRPTGYARTYPNLMTQEGIRGDEESPPNDMVINTIFTRMIAGAGDQTNCYFADRVTKKMGSHATQMAKSICIYSPWQFLYWYDRPIGSPSKQGGAGNVEGYIQEIPDLAFYDQLPTVWDDTKIIDGYPGKLAVIARKSGEIWFLGAIAGDEPHNLRITLSFLEKDKKYSADIYADDESLTTSTKLKIQEREVTSHSIFEQQILAQNGLAVIFSPLN